MTHTHTRSASEHPSCADMLDGARVGELGLTGLGEGWHSGPKAKKSKLAFVGHWCPLVADRKKAPHNLGKGPRKCFLQGCPGGKGQVPGRG